MVYASKGNKFIGARTKLLQKSKKPTEIRKRCCDTCLWKIKFSTGAYKREEELLVPSEK